MEVEGGWQVDVGVARQHQPADDLSLEIGLLQVLVPLADGPALAAFDHLGVEGTDGREGGCDFQGDAFGVNFQTMVTAERGVGGSGSFPDVGDVQGQAVHLLRPLA